MEEESAPDFSSWTVPRLKDFLKQNNARRTGNKAQLVHYASLYFDKIKDSPESVVNGGIKEIVSELREKRKIFENPTCQWICASDVHKSLIPTNFNIATITDFLTKRLIEIGEETFQSGTSKPAVKGRKMYLSEKVQFCEQGSHDAKILFRATVEASFTKNKFRYPCIALENDGSIFVSQCTCEQSSGGQCTHVATLLYLIEDLSLGQVPRINKACTSKPQQWNQGKKRAKEPKPINEAVYEKKGRINSDAYNAIDLRCSTLQCTTKSEVNGFVVNLQAMKKTPNWLSTLRIHYDDYEIPYERKIVLEMLRFQFLANLQDDITAHDQDILSNKDSVHVTGTEKQSDCHLWFQKRKLRITASKFAAFAKNPLSYVVNMWKPSSDLSRISAVKWGNEHEKDAIMDYSRQFGPVMACGLFISRQHPFLAASPDGIQDKVIVEIKCPYVLKNTNPNDLESLTSSQRSSYFCEKIDGNLCLKRSHAYFAQVQCQMLVTGMKKTNFVV